MRRCQVFIPYQEGIVTLEELGGINKEFICFNPEMIEGGPDYKIQMADRILLKFEGEEGLISILDYKDEFIIIDSKGKKITDSLNTNPGFVRQLIQDIIDKEDSITLREDMN